MKKCSISLSRAGLRSASDLTSAWVCDLAATAINRSLRSVLPFSLCSAIARSFGFTRAATLVLGGVIWFGFLRHRRRQSEGSRRRRDIVMFVSCSFYKCRRNRRQSWKRGCQLPWFLFSSNCRKYFFFANRSVPRLKEVEDERTSSWLRIRKRNHKKEATHAR
jgi:hypothetical protein